MSPQTHAFAFSGSGDSGTRAQQFEGFCVSWPLWDDCAAVSPVPTGTWNLMGFGVIESPVGASPVDAEGFKVERLDRLDLCTEAVAPKALKLVNPHRVGFAVVLFRSPKACIEYQ